MPQLKQPTGLREQALTTIARDLSSWRGAPHLIQELPRHVFNDLLEYTFSYNKPMVRDEDKADMFQLFACPNVSHINPGRWTTGKTSVTDVLRRCTHVEDLTLTAGILEQTDFGLVLSVGDLSHLTKLRVIFCDINDKHLLALSERCPSLQELDVGRCKKISTLGMTNLVRLQQDGSWTGGCLKKLQLLGTNVTVKGITHILDHAPKLLEVAHRKILKAIGNSSRERLALEHLRIDLGPRFSKNDLYTSFELCPRLRIVEMFMNGWSRPDVYECFAATMFWQSEITQFTFSHQCNLYEDVMPVFDYIGSSLTMLDLEDVEAFSVVSLGQSCPYVEELTVGILSWSGGSSFERATKPLFQNLRNVNLMQFRAETHARLTETKFLHVLLDNCHQLEILELHDIDIVDDTFIRELISCNPLLLLKALSFSGAKFTSGGIWKLVHHCPVLKEVALDDETCPNITEDSIEEMAQNAAAYNWDITFSVSMDTFGV